MKTIKLEIEKRYNDSGKLIFKSYSLNGERHNPYGPAVKEWNDYGNLICEEYWLDGKRHNPDGPAYQSWYDNGELICKEYYLEGKELTKEEFEKQTQSFVSEDDMDKSKINIIISDNFSMPPSEAAKMRILVQNTGQHFAPEAKYNSISDAHRSAKRLKKIYSNFGISTDIIIKD